MVKGIPELEWMLDHELRLAERHRRFVSLTMVKSDSKINQKELLSNTIRNSDVYFEFNESLGAILMSETDISGALVAVERYKKICNGDFKLRFAVGTYPQDNHPAPRFVSTVYKRMKKAELQEPGTVVTEGL